MRSTFICAATLALGAAAACTTPDEKTAPAANAVVDAGTITLPITGMT